MCESNFKVGRNVNLKCRVTKSTKNTQGTQRDVYSSHFVFLSGRRDQNNFAVA